MGDITPEQLQAIVGQAVAAALAAAGVPQESDAPRFADLVRQYREHVVEAGHLSASRARALRRHCALLVDRFPELPAAEFRMTQVSELRKALDGKPAEFGMVAQTVRQVFRWAREEGLFTGPDRLRRLKSYQSRRRERVLTVDEWQALWDAFGARWHKYGRSVSDLCRFMLLTGLRPGQISAMEWGQVSLRFRSVELPEFKGHGPRTLPLSPRAVEVIEAQPRTNRYVFAGPRYGKQIGSSSIRHAWGRACELAGVEKCPPYTARHTIATWSLETGAKPHVVADLLGHTPAMLLKHYAHADKAAVRTLAESVVPS